LSEKKIRNIFSLQQIQIMGEKKMVERSRVKVNGWVNYWIISIHISLKSNCHRNVLSQEYLDNPKTNVS